MLDFKNIFKSSGEISLKIKDLLINSNYLEKKIQVGFHPMRYAGRGENFWQYKEYNKGDILSSIDWRKSASSNRILVKEKEKETSKTIYIFFDTSKSMLYQNNDKSHNKLYKSALIAFTVSRLLLNKKEDVFLFDGTNNPVKCLPDLTNIKQDLFEKSNLGEFPAKEIIKPKSHIFIISDFLYNTEKIYNYCRGLKSKEVLGSLIQVLDRREIDFAFDKDLEVLDLETDEVLVINNIEKFRNNYITKFKEFKFQINNYCNNYNWNYFEHISDMETDKFLINLCKIFFNKIHC